MVSTVDFYNISESFSFDESEIRTEERKDVKSSNTKANQKKSTNVIRRKSKEKYSCTFCNESFKRQDRLDRHLFTHTKQKLFCCDVEGCSKSYTNNSHLNRHKKSSHKPELEEPSIKCEHVDCYYVFTTRSNMKRHFQSHHANPLPYSCSQCGEKFRRKLQMKRHEIKTHSGQYPYTCLQCKKGFFNTFTFSRHQEVHRLESSCSKRSCPDCGKIFEKWSLMVEHRRKEHKPEARFGCDLCDKSFYRKPNLKEHMKLHMSKVEVFQCTYESCSKFYVARRNLMSHIRSKHERRKWICDLCDKQLTSKQKLQQHLLAHLDPARVKLVTMRRVKRKKASMLSKIVGVQLPDEIDESRKLYGECSHQQIESLLEPQSTHETSELSDF